MATEKILIFDEAGNAKRMKVRIARFLDNEPVTDSDKENIRTTLNVDGSQSGTFTTPLSVTSASDSSFTGGGKVGIGTSSPAHPLTLTANPGAANTPVAWLHNSGNVSEYDGTVISTVNDGSDVEVLHVRTNTTTYDGGTSLMLVQGDGKVGIGSAPGSYNSNANNLVVGTGSGSEGMTIASGTTGEGGIYFADGTTGNQQYRGYLGYGHTNDELFFGTEGVTKWKLNSTGNLVPQSSGLGIDFGSGGASSLLDDYERGTATPTDASGAGLTLAGVGCNYVKIGSQVTAWVKVTYPTTSDTSFAKIGGFPFAFGASDIDRIGGFVVYQNTGLDVAVLGSNSAAEVTFRNNSGNEYTNAQLSAKVIWFCVTYDVS